MTEDALAKRFHHKTTQSEYLGIGFGIILAKMILKEQEPDYHWVAVDAEMALDAGFDMPRFTAMRPRTRRGTTMRPDYFMLGHRLDGGRSRTRFDWLSWSARVRTARTTQRSSLGRRPSSSPQFA